MGRWLAGWLGSHWLAGLSNGVGMELLRAIETDLSDDTVEFNRLLHGFSVSPEVLANAVAAAGADDTLWAEHTFGLLEYDLVTLARTPPAF